MHKSMHSLIHWLADRCNATFGYCHQMSSVINGNIPYEEACRLLNILPLADRRLELCRTLFQQIMQDDTHVLHHLLPPKRDTQLTGRLRSLGTYPTVYVRTSHFKNSFILHGLNKFQWLHSITNLNNCFFVYVWLCECMYYVCIIQPTGCQSLINLCYVMLRLRNISCKYVHFPMKYRRKQRGCFLLKHSVDWLIEFATFLRHRIVDNHWSNSKYGRCLSGKFACAVVSRP